MLRLRHELERRVELTENHADAFGCKHTGRGVDDVLLFVENVEASVGYYCEKLGFNKSYGDDTFAQVERNGLEIMLGRKDLEPGASSGTVLSMSLRSPDGLGDLYQRFKGNDARISSKPYEVAWQKGTYELRVEDLDGNILLITPKKQNVPIHVLDSKFIRPLLPCYFIGL